jgi:hypothetical protein
MQMNRKTISKVLKSKLTKWANSITDEKVRELVLTNTLVTGGSIASMLMNENVNDFDVYFKNKETVLAVSNYYVNQFNELNKGRTNKLGKPIEAYVLDGADKAKVASETLECKGAGHLLNLTPDRVKIVIRSDGVIASNQDITKEPFENAVDALAEADGLDGDKLDDSGDENYTPVFLSSNAITLSNRIQIVVRFYGEPGEIHKNYDFTHCTNHYDLGNKELVLRPEALECILSRELRYQGSLYPLCSVIRTRKFIKRGFNINAGQYLKMLFQVSKLDLTNIEVLEDQLVGVDSAYFGMLIDALKSKADSDPSFVIDGSYVATLIDRIF